MVGTIVWKILKTDRQSYTFSLNFTSVSLSSLDIKRITRPMNTTTIYPGYTRLIVLFASPFLKSNIELTQLIKVHTPNEIRGHQPHITGRRHLYGNLKTFSEYEHAHCQTDHVRTLNPRPITQDNLYIGIIHLYILLYTIIKLYPFNKKGTCVVFHNPCAREHFLHILSSATPREKKEINCNRTPRMCSWRSSGSNNYEPSTVFLSLFLLFSAAEKDPRVYIWTACDVAKGTDDHGNVIVERRTREDVARTMMITTVIVPLNPAGAYVRDALKCTRV